MPAILKVHWEAWSDCNLTCPFCYRMKSVPLSTQAATEMISRVASWGVRDFVFAGGDPFIRTDLRILVEAAKENGLKVELQTNCERRPPDLSDWISLVDLFGLSIDGASPVIHDMMRMRRGNHAKVLAMRDLLEARGVRYVVRTVVARPNSHNVVGIGELIRHGEGLARWSLLEFSPVGEGARNSSVYKVTPGEYQEVVEQARKAYGTQIAVDAYFGEAKKAVYFLVRSDGHVYTTENLRQDGTYPTVGSILTDDPEALLERLSIRVDRHAARYGALMHEA
jgi:MoaA/NifB/PqqE/SkfB family radical SAM enzyme